MNIPQPEHGGNGESEGVVNQSLPLRPIAPRFWWFGFWTVQGGPYPPPPLISGWANGALLVASDGIEASKRKRTPGPSFWSWTVRF